ncbi:MAG: rnr [Burkholderiaceae bacterium]|nr:rnr [Burkholderiaceae bacterium]
MKSNSKKNTSKNNTQKNSITTEHSVSNTNHRAKKTTQPAALLTARASNPPATQPANLPKPMSKPQGTRIDKMAGLPSKSTIFDVIFTHANVYRKPINMLALAQELDVPPTKVSGLQVVVEQLTASGDIKMSPKGLLTPNSEQNLVRGVLQSHKDGYGFVNNPDGEDVFVNERNMNGAWHGDKVAVRIIGTARNGKREGDVVEVTERRFAQVVGHLLRENGVWLVSPDDVRLRTDILVDASELKGATVNQIVVVALTEYGNQYTLPTGRIVEVLGNADDAGMEIEIAVRKFDIPHVFSPATERQTAQLPDTVLESDLKGRVDLRDVPLVTIDGEDARDFDDAVYCEPIKSGRKTTGYRLIVAIADVSHYVQDKTPLNEDAILRSTSVYFPRRVIPMLPEKLSNGLCSLNPHVDRLCMVADMVLDLDGHVTAYQFYPAVIHSQARLTYTQVWEYLSEGTGVLANEHKAVAPHIKNLYALFHLQLQSRGLRGAMEFETTETYIVSDENGKIKEILPRTRNDAHRLIEECMLCANVCAAEFIEQSGRTSLYRVHEGPTPEKLEILRKNLMMAGLRMGGGDKPTPQDYAEVMRQVVDRPDAQTLQTLLLRSMQQAVYAPDNLGHFGLAYAAYTHFTSPIRRYPDLLIHRTIKAILLGQRYTPSLEGFTLLEDTRKKTNAVDNAVKHADKQHAQPDAHQMTWQRLGEHTSMCERRADEASRDVTAWLKCEYMKQFIGEVMAGKISAVTQFGAFVTLDAVYVDGLIHISELGQDYFEFDEASFSLKGRASGMSYRLGDAVSVRIAGVDSDTRKIDFVLEGGVKKGDKDSAHKNTRAQKSTASKSNDAPSKSRRGSRRK